MKIYLDENHRYRDEQGREYESVSSVIDRYTPEFKKYPISRAIAKRDNRNQQDILAEWKRKSDISLLTGHYIHDMLEHCLKEPELAQNSPIHYEIQKIHNLLPQDERWVQEKILADTDNFIAGTADLLTIGDAVTIWDFKTNDLDKPAYQNFLPPINLPHTKTNEYRLQLSFYQHFLEKMGYQVRGLKLINILQGDVEVVDLEPLCLSNNELTTILNATKENGFQAER